MDGKMDAEALACLASCLQHGWLRLYDVKGPPTYQLSCGKSPYRDNVVWQQRYCVLSDTKLMLLDKDEVHPSLLQERRSESCSVSMLRRTVSVPSKAGRTASGSTDDDPDAILDRVPRREGAPTLVTMKSNTIDGCTPPPFTVTGFISKRLKRTKSQSKLDRSITLRSRLPILGLSNSPAPSLKESHSHESLLGHGRAEALELSQGVRVRPLHCSILGQEHCFEIMAPGTIKCFSCRSAAERDRWLDSFSRALHPNRDNMCREEVSLRLWLIEARHLPPKKRFFCEVCVDDMLLARTAARLRPEGPFWGERFHFTSLGLSSMANITIHVYRSSGRGTGDGAKRRRKKERSSGGSGAYVGLVNIPANTVEGRHLVEQWYPLSAPTPGRGKAPTPTVRVRTLLRRARVLPLERYKAFAEHVTGEYGPLCNALEAALSARDKEEVAGCLVRTLHSTGRAKEFLTQVVMAEVERCGDDQLIFRENTLATKAIEEYLKLVGQRYLQDALGDFIKALYESEEQCEVDPSKVPASQLSENQTNLKMCCELAFCKIINSFCVFPRELKEVFSAWRLHCAECGRPEVTERLIGSSLFLRFLCPAVMAPSLFGLTHEYPGEGTARTLTLIAKVIQNLANFSRFGSKELYMAFMNEFLESETSSMHSLLADVSSTGGSGAGPEFDGRVDLGLELALLHDTLFDVLPTLGKAGLAQLGPLPQLVNDLMADLASPPPLNQQLRHLSGRFSSTPNVSGSISSGLQSIIEDEEKPTAMRTSCTSRTGEQQQVHHEPSPKVSAPSPSLDGQPQHEPPVHWSTGKSQSLLDLQPAEGTRTPALCFQNPLYDVPQNAHAERLSEWSPMSSGAGREDETKHHTYCGSEDQGRHGGLSLAFAAHRLPMVAQQAKLKSLTIGMARVEEPLEASLLEPNTHVQGARWREMSSPLPGLARFSSGSSQEDESPSPAPRSTSLRQKPLPPEGTGSEAALSPSERTAAWLLAVPCGGIPRTPADTPPPLPPRPLLDNGPLEQLSELRNVLHAEQCAREEVEQRLAAREESERRLLVEYRARLTDAEERLRRAQIDKDAQMKGIVARLIAVEEERKREQAEMQQIIETQKQRITSLEENNGHLLNAVTQLQEHCARQTRNGLPSTSQSLSPKLTITENGEFTHSTC